METARFGTGMSPWSCERSMKPAGKPRRRRYWRSAGCAISRWQGLGRFGGVPASRRERPSHARAQSGKVRTQAEEEYPGEAARHRALLPNPLPRPSLLPPWAIYHVSPHLPSAQGRHRGPAASRFPHRSSPNLRPWTRNAARRAHIVA